MQMKNSLSKLVIILIVPIVVLVHSCKKDKTEVTPPPTTTNSDITYNAAYVVNGGSNSISVIDISTNEVKKTIALANVMWPHHISINTTKTKVAIGVPGMDLSGGHGNINNSGMTGMIAIYDAIKGTELKMINLSMMNHNAAFSPNGTEIWTSLMDSMGIVQVYDANTYQLKSTIHVGMMPAEVTFSFDGSMAFVANGMSNDVTAINVANKTVMATITVGQEPVGAWQGSNNKMYVDNEMGQSISVIDVSTMSVEETVNLGFMPGMAAYQADMNELWVSDPDNGKVHYWKRSGNAWVHDGVFSTGAGTHAIVFKGMTAYISNQLAGTVSVIDVMMHTKIKDITVGTKPNGMVIKQ
jgi:YVTN family beta-propeller protein